MATGATAIRQAPGWWASLCRAECDECGWVGPVRNTNEARDDNLLWRDKREHRCGGDATARLDVQAVEDL
jgi:hypothetical protein